MVQMEHAIQAMPEQDQVRKYTISIKYTFGDKYSTIMVQMVHAIQAMTAQDQVRKYTISTLLRVQIVLLWYKWYMLFK